MVTYHSSTFVHYTHSTPHTPFRSGDLANAILENTRIKFSIYNRDLYFFYNGDNLAKQVLVSLATGATEFPTIPLANPTAVHKWVVKTNAGKYYLKGILKSGGGGGGTEIQNI